MYTFDDRNGDSLTLRPEGTACCVRAGIENGLFHNQAQKLWYSGPMFRHERLQKGRYRQFHQFGVEAFNFDGPDIDAELIMMTARLWRCFNLNDLELQINSLGTPQCRSQYREVLIEYFSRHIALLDNDSERRLLSNPLRILDSKNPDMQELISRAPKLVDYLDEESTRHFADLAALLDKAGIKYSVNPRLVRGLDYYNKTVFEWVTQRLGTQGTVCAGKRYDDLVEQLNGKSVPATSFTVGIERLIELVKSDLNPLNLPHAYLVLVGEAAERKGLVIAESLRDELPALRLLTHCGGGGFKSQFKRADKSGAKLALVMGEDEINNASVSIKYLREDKPQQTVPIVNLADVLRVELN